MTDLSSDRLRSWWRRARLGLPTVLGLRPGGYFIPYRYAAATSSRAGGSPGGSDYPLMADRLAGAEPAMARVLGEIEPFADALARIGDEPPPEPRWAQDWFPRLDAAVLYGLVRSRRPRQVIEVGSGHSTRFLCRAIRDGALDTAVTAIDPAPRADLADLPVTLRREPLQSVEAGLFDGLGPGDFLLIDSSHILMPGTDLDRLLGAVLPALAPGVLVQFHDIFLPDGYPAHWVWRGYNEQQALAPLVIGGGWDPIFASHYLVTRQADWLRRGPLADLPRPEGALESAFWIHKTGA